MERKSSPSSYKSSRSKSPRSSSQSSSDEYFSIDEGPTEVIVEIMEQMDYETLKSWCRTNRRIKSICDSKFGERFMKRKHDEFLKSYVPSYNNWFVIKTEYAYMIFVIIPIKNRNQAQSVVKRVQSQNSSSSEYITSTFVVMHLTLQTLGSFDENTLIGIDYGSKPFQLVKHNHQKIVFLQDMTAEEKKATNQGVKAWVKDTWLKAWVMDRAWTKSFRRIQTIMDG